MPRATDCSSLKPSAAGYVLRRGAAKEMIGAIHTMVAFGLYLNATLAGPAVVYCKSSRGKVCRRGIDLSDREEQVVCLVAAGRSNKEIIGRLGLSVRTAETYAARPLEKLGLHSQGDLVRYAPVRGWPQER